MNRLLLFWNDKVVFRFNKVTFRFNKVPFGFNKQRFEINKQPSKFSKYTEGVGINQKPFAVGKRLFNSCDVFL